MIRRPPRSTLFPYTRSSDLHANTTSARLLPIDAGANAAPRTRTPAGDPERIVPEWPCLCRERSEEHTSELQSRRDLVCRLLLEKKKKKKIHKIQLKRKKRRT